MTAQTYNCHVISNTHWDREWRYPFQAYRIDLVELMDRLLDILDKRPDYRAFFLDSQTVILEDYLEIRPEAIDRIRKHTASNRLQIGPWYTLPDAWGCPGETLLRNLLMGHRTAKNYGPVSKVGYTPFNNGQISQFPQMYREFGIDGCFFYRGVGKHVARPEFLWRGSDGSELYSFKFGDYARYNYYYMLYRPGLLGMTLQDREYQWETEQTPYRMAVEQHQDRQYAWMNLKLELHEELLPEAVQMCREKTAEDVTSSELLYMMGHDHSFPAEEELDLIEAAAREAEKRFGDKIFHSSLEDYMKAFRGNHEELQVLEGEMRHENKLGLWTHLMANILSCRLYLKQRNARVNTKVINGAEPLAACASLGGTEYPHRFLEIAWKKMLVNHAHDAIGGCSVDQVHEEMLTRWNDVETISDEISRRSLRDIASRIDGSAIDPKNLQLTVFNTLPYPRTDAIEVIIDLPHAEPGTSFTIQNTRSEPLPVQELSRERYSPTIESPLELSMPFNVERVRALVFVEDLTAMGYDTLVIRPGEESRFESASLVAGKNVLENEHLRVEVNANGTLKLTDKRTGRVRDELCYLEDTAAFGDPWSRVVPEGDAPIYSKDKVKAEVAVLHDGPLRGALRVTYAFEIPARKDPDANARSKETIALPVELIVALDKDKPTADVTLTIDNQAKDHRLRLILPTQMEKATHSTAEGQCDVISRSIKLPDPEGYVEKPYATKPMWNWVDISDGEEGFGIINDGVIEYEATDDDVRTLAITLMRCFGKFVFGRPTPGAQCQGTHTFRFALYPHGGDWKASEIVDLTARHITGPQALLSAPTRGDQPARRSFLSIEPRAATFLAIKPAEEGSATIVRFYNPLEESLDVTLSSELPIAGARQLTAEELPVADLPVADNTIAMTAAPKKIVTLAIEFQP